MGISTFVKNEAVAGPTHAGRSQGGTGRHWCGTSNHGRHPSGTTAMGTPSTGSNQRSAGEQNQHQRAKAFPEPHHAPQLRTLRPCRDLYRHFAPRAGWIHGYLYPGSARSRKTFIIAHLQAALTVALGQTTYWVAKGNVALDAAIDKIDEIFTDANDETRKESLVTRPRNTMQGPLL